MKNPFSIEKSYKVRHKILEVLYNDWDKNHRDYSRRIGSIKITNETKIPIGDIHSFQYLLVDNGEIVISDNDGQSMMTILEKGVVAFIDNKYIRQGRQAMWDGIFAWARILIPLGALILSIINYVSNQSISNKVKEIEIKIEQSKK